MTTEKTVTIEKTVRPEYEGGGFAYTMFVNAPRNGSMVKIAVERSGRYADMIMLGQKRAKSIGASFHACAQ